MKTLEEQIKSAKRELDIRKKVYPRWVQKGNMEPKTAEHEIRCMQAIVERLELQKAKGMT